MALTPGSRCPCGCKCAVPGVANPRGCPCPCGACNTCNSRVRGTQAESAPAGKTAGRTTIRESRETPMTPPTRPVTDAEFKLLLEAISGTRAAAPAPAPVVKAVEPPLHTLSNEQLGQRLLRSLAENHRSPYWAAVNENAGSAPAAAPSTLAEQAQALPIVPQSMTLSEALMAGRDLRSPSWNRTPARTVFDEPGR